MKYPRFGRYSYLCVEAVLEFPSNVSLSELEVALQSFEISRLEDGPPFQGGLVGFFDYEFSDARSITETHFQPGREAAYFRVYDTVIAIDHLDDCYWVLSSGLSSTSRRSDRKAAQDRVKSICNDIDSLLARGAQPVNVDWHRQISDEHYARKVKEVKTHISAGDIYQANLSHALDGELPQAVTRFDLYSAIRQSNPAPFSAFGSFGNRGIACTSPERLFSASAGGLIEARPIKGTIPRSNDFDTDERLKERLRNSAKDRAENTMIVDLLRNDLSQVCLPNSVEIPELCKLESYAGLHQLTSSVRGEMRDGLNAFDAFAAIFPGGSVTGAPKLRAMEIIDELEQEPRRAFCGSFGYFGFDGAADFNIMIRTIQMDRTQLKLNIGGGITALSEPADELAETLLKAQKILDGTYADEEVI
ncbi:MAG: anthranilate synthase component I family protein [Pseudomonadota bacterium]